MFGKLTAPYAEYTLRIKLDPEEFRDRLEKECCHAFEFTVFPTPHLRGCGLFAGFSDVVLEPVFFSRNPWRGLVYIKPEKIPDSAETLLRVTIKPNPTLLYLSLAPLPFIIVISVFFVFKGIGAPFLIAAAVTGLGVFIDWAIRESAESEVPEIQRMLNELLRKIETF